ncbi:MAG: DNA topoisomerase 3 [Bacteroidales bacterium]|nr:DNA topoisomerase 3 [Bacteroidales bacterium]
MIVCVTEKPSVARDIAAIVGATTSRDGYLEGNGYKVTWTYGHLCCLKEPADYTEWWKRWSLSSLPMVPPKFGIKLIPEARYEHQFNVIRSLIAEADEVINCGDAGQEGELIQRWVMQKADIHCPVKRLWINDLTDASIREGLSHLMPAEHKDNLYLAGLSRAIGDWLLGMNATRLYSLKYSSPGKVLSIGRVQTPTLAMIVDRHKEITNFQPEDFWELKTSYRGVQFNATGGRFSSETDAEEACRRIKEDLFVVKDVTEKKGKEAPPRLFDLTSLQVECNKQWGWSAEETLRLIQTLYEKKVTTYPRVDTTYLNDAIYAKIPDILRRMTPYSNLTGPILSKGKLPKSKKVFDNSKVTDHHAIIPTGQLPNMLAGNEKLLYHLIARRFIANFYPDCEFMSTTVLGEAADVKFKAIGKVIVSAGWRTVFGKDNRPDGDGSSDDKILPEFSVGESGAHEPAVVKKTTQPPKYYTDATLLRAMETAGKTVEDEELRDALKMNGIGRPSTRAAIIETLVKRRYIYRQRKNIMVTQAGIDLIDTIDEELLKSAKLTGIWENKLRQIEDGLYSAAEFIEELKAMIGQIVNNVLSDNSMKHIEVIDDSESAKKSKGSESQESETGKTKPARKRAPAIKSLEQIACPVCGKGHLLKGRTAYGCSCYASGCTFKLMFSEVSDSISPAKVAAAIKKIYK